MATAQVQIMASNFATSKFQVVDTFSPAPPATSVRSPPATRTLYQTTKTPEKKAEASPRRNRDSRVGGKSTKGGQSPHASGSVEKSPAAPKSASDIFSLSDPELTAKYQFCEEVGFGNWGSVWKCRPKANGDSAPMVAVKLVHRSKNPTSAARVRSLWQEFKCIRALRPLSHPNVIDFQSFIITPSYALITMAYHPRVMPVALPEAKAREFFRQLCDAVGFLHRHGCVHNDIKPANILLSDDEKPVLVDFGFSQNYASASTDQYLSNLSWGTPEYLSPERARGILHDERLSDVWALGVTMYEIVVGRTPFEQTDAEEFLTREALEVYYNRTTTGNFFGEYTISKEFEDLIHSMVEPNVHLRLQSCGKALRHCFFEPTPAIMSSRATRGDSNKPIVTPPRPAAGASSETPGSSSARKYRKVGNKLVKTDEKSKTPIKVYRDSPSSSSPAQTRSSTSRPPSTPSRVLADRVNTTPVTSPVSAAVVKATPISKIPVPIRKVEISTPLPLQRVTPTKRSPPTPISIQSPPPLPTFSPVLLKLSAKKSGSAQPHSPPIKSPSWQSLSNRAKVEVEEKESSEESVEVLTATRTIVPPPRSSSQVGFYSSPTTPISASGFFYAPTPSPDTTATSYQSTGSMAFEDTSSKEFTAFARTAGRPSLASKLRKLSLKRAPSSMSFRGIKSSITQVGRRRASTAGSIIFTMIDHPLHPRHDNDQNAMTMPISFESSKLDTELDVNGERARLESFSRHIQTIIDARKGEIPQVSKRSIVPKSSRTEANISGPTKESAILSPSEVQEVRAQFAQELAEERRKNSISKISVGPRVIRSGSVSRVAAQPSKERVAIKIRPSLAPSFVAAGGGTSITPTSSVSTVVPAPEEPIRSPLSSVSTVSSVSSSTAGNDLTATFKPGHKRIPTAIRNVPSILLTESADDESESEWSRAETPCSERVASPPPTPRVVEEGRQLPTWVPENFSEGEDEDGDVDEPTITISQSSTPNKLVKRQPSRAPSHSSSTGLFQQFVRATPGVNRGGKSGPRSILLNSTSSNRLNQSVEHETLVNSSPSPKSPIPDPYRQDFEARIAGAFDSSRSSSRATTHSHKRSIVSFFFGETTTTAGSRPVTPACESLRSAASQSSISLSASGTTASESGFEGGGKVKKAGKFRRALKKLF